MNKQKLSQARAVSLMVPATETRAQKKERLEREKTLRTELDAEARTEAEALTRENRELQRIRQLVKPAGLSGPHRLRTHSRLKITPHQASTATLRAAYPFIAERGLGTRGLLVGHDAFSGEAFFYDPFVLYGTALSNPNIALFGEIGSGKSSLAKSLVTRSIAFGRRAYIPGDPKGEWTAVTRAVGGMAVRIGPGLDRVNPLDEGTRPATMSETEWAAEIKSTRLELLRSLAETIMNTGMRPPELSALSAALNRVTSRTATPELGHIVHELLNPSADVILPQGFESRNELIADSRLPGHALSQMITGELAGIFDGPSTTRFDPTLPAISLDLSALGENSPSMPLVQTCTSAWMEASVRDPDGGQRWMIYDEAWKQMRSVPLLRRMQARWKLARAWGLVNMLVLHRISDLDAVGDHASEEQKLAAGLLADCGTRIIYTQKPDQLSLTARTLELTKKELERLPELPQATGLWKVGTRSFLIRHDWSEMEAALFSTDVRMTV